MWSSVSALNVCMFFGAVISTVLVTLLSGGAISNVRELRFDSDEPSFTPVKAFHGPDATATAVSSAEQDSLSAFPPLKFESGAQRSSPGTGTEVLALVITGLRHRLLFDTTVSQVVRPLVEDGLQVHVYISLVENTTAESFRTGVRSLGRESPATAGLTRGELRDRIAEMVGTAGGCLMYCSIWNSSESLPPLPQGRVWQERLRQYLPERSGVGRNILRVWKSREMLWERALQAEQDLRMNYSLALWMREDSFWGERISDLGQLARTPDAARALWSKGCKTFAGINDRTVLLGREAAEVMLRAWSWYLKPAPPLQSDNAEVYLQALATSAGLDLRVLMPLQLPSMDAVFVGGAQPICIVGWYSCLGPRYIQTRGMVFCEHLETEKARREKKAAQSHHEGHGRRTAM